MMRPDRRAVAGLVLLACVACTDQPTAPARLVPPNPNLALLGDDDAVGFSGYLANVNSQAAAKGVGIAVARAEVLLSDNAPIKTPRIIFANDRELRFDSRFVARDLRRLSTDATLSYAVFSPLANATFGGPVPGEAAFDATFATWNAVSCSKLVVRKKALAPGQFPSFILTGLFPPADINDIGFLPGAIIDLLLGTGASQFVVGVTITFVFIQPGSGIPTDIDGDGTFDTAFKEVWLNDAFAYSNTGAANRIDIQTAALHEHGHALELGHFGKLVFDPKTGKVQVSPRAVMNAVLLGTLRAPLGTDNAGICGNFGSWQ